MVHYLLEQGAQPDPSIRMGFFHPPLFMADVDFRNMVRDRKFLPSLIYQYREAYQKAIPQGKFLECLILILNAWKGKIGIDRLREDEHAKEALNLALEIGHSGIAELLIGYGIQPNQKNCSTWAENGVSRNNLPMLEMLHRRQLFDFIRFRHSDGHTLLALAVTHNNTEALEFLQKIGVPDVIGEDGKSDSEAGHERFTKSMLIKF
jgi:ankyrin repeat protein